jgi:hypothetical protein
MQYTFPGDMAAFTGQFIQNGQGIFIDENGFVGVGTNEPIAPLEVSHEVNINTGSYDNLSLQLVATGENTTANHWVEGFGAYLVNEATSSGSGKNNLYGFWAEITNAGDCHGIYAFTGIAFHNAPNTVTEVDGINAMIQATAGGTITNAKGLWSTIVATGNNSHVENAYCIYVNNITGNGGSIANSYGLYINALVGNYKWGIYVNDPADNYFAGQVGIGTDVPTAALDLNTDTMRLRTSRTPASAGAAGNAGDICWDANYIYVCVAGNTWKRASLYSW